MRCDLRHGTWLPANFTHSAACPRWNGAGHRAACDQAKHPLMTFLPSVSSSGSTSSCDATLFASGDLRMHFTRALGGRRLRFIGDSLTKDHYTYITRCLLNCSISQPVRQTLLAPTKRWIQLLKRAGFDGNVSSEAVTRLQKHHGDEWYYSGCDVGTSGHVDFRRLNQFPGSSLTSKHPQLVAAMMHCLVNFRDLIRGTRHERALGSSDVIFMNVGLHRDAAMRQRVDDVVSWFEHARQLAHPTPRLLWRDTSPQHFMAPNGRFRTAQDVLATTQCRQLPDGNRTTAQHFYGQNVTARVLGRHGSVLPIFDATWARADDHPPLRLGAIRVRASSFNRSFGGRSDCTHYCITGSVLRFWTQALIAWLQESTDDTILDSNGSSD